MGNSSRKRNAAISKNTGENSDSKCDNEGDNSESKCDNDEIDIQIEQNGSPESTEESSKDENIKMKIKNISQERLSLFLEIDLAKQLNEEFSNVDVTLDEKTRELYLQGPRGHCNDGLKMYQQINSDISEDTFKLPSNFFASIIESDFGKEYYRDNLAKEKITARFFVKNDCEINIAAVNSDHLTKAKELFQESLREEKVSLSSEDFSLVKSGKCEEIFKKVNDSQHVKIEKATENVIVLYGLAETNLIEARKEIEDFLFCFVRSQSTEIPDDAAHLLNGHFFYRVKELEERLSESHVSIQIFEGTETVLINGTQEGITKCKEYLFEIYGSFVKKKSKMFSSPGLAKFLSGETGQPKIKEIEQDNHVFIKMNTLEDVAAKTMIRRVRSIKMNARELRPVSKDTKPANEVYDICNFTSKEGVKVSWKYGNIEHEKVDVIVSSAMPNLNFPTACGKALNAVGGPLFIKACKPLTNIPFGDIAVTIGGDLCCVNVLHAVCCDWNRGKTNAVKVLHDLLKKILNKCVELRASSVVLPTIGTGAHKFPEIIFFQVLKQEIELFSASSRHKPALNDITVVVFDTRKKKRTSANPGSQLSLTDSRCADGATSASSENLREVNFGKVRVSLHVGDITQHPLLVDAIINVLPNDLVLSSGGGVCKSILKNGGEIIQQQLNHFSECPPGSVLETCSGSVKNAKYIIHCVPTSTGIPGIRSTLEKCFKEAKELLLKIISISAIGTVSFNISATGSAESILDAAKSFSAANYTHWK